MKRFALCLSVAVLSLCGAHAAGPNPGGLTPREGFAQVQGGPVWYRIFGSGPGTPLLIVHGGPGGRSCTYEPLADIVGKDRPVIVYDQLGCGRSGRPMDPSLWNVDRSVQELGQLRAALGLKKFHLMGHSWGGAVVAAYLTKARPKGVQSAVLAGPLLSTPMWIEDANLLLAELPEDVQAILKRHEQAGTTQSKDYQEAAEVFYSRFLYHKSRPPLPAACVESKANNEIYMRMWGPSEFYASGTLRSFDITPDLPSLRLPVLIVVGRHDEVRPETASRFQAMIPGARLAVIEDCGHMAPIEDPVGYARILETFLRQF